MRPLGAILFGHFGDRFGRKPALMISLLMMAIPTLAMGCLPTYSQIGILAPLLLMICRLVQGLSVGGEYTSSIVYLVEHSPPNRKGFAGSFVLVGAGLGWLLGSFVASQTLWGWRIPFLLGGLTGLFGLLLRQFATETSPFTALKQSQKVLQNPIREVLFNQKATLCLVIGLNLLSTVAGYLIYAYMPTYLHREAGIPLSDALMINTIMLLIFVILVPLVGWLSDKVERVKLLFLGAVGFLCLSYPLFLMLHLQSVPLIVTSLLIMTVLIALYHAPLPTIMAEIFPIETRANSVGLSYNLAASLFSGTCPLMCTLMIQFTGSNLSPAYYLILVSLISGATALVATINIGKVALQKN